MDTDVNDLPKSQEICQRLLRGYQFSDSDLYSPGDDELYTILDGHFEQFRGVLAAVGFSLERDDGVMFLQKDDKALSNEEKQSIVVLYLLADLWMESGKPYSDLFSLTVAWHELDWFRDGYGREYLAQTGIEDNDLSAIEDLLRRLARKGLVDYRAETSTVTLRKPAERVLNMARRIHNQMKAQGGMTDE